MEKKSNPHNTAQKAAMYVSSISIIVNLLLSLFKLIAGIIARSDAMISDTDMSVLNAYHPLSSRVCFW